MKSASSLLRNHIVLFSVLLLLASAQLRAQSVQTYVIPDTVSIGDTFSFVITAQYPANRYQATYPDSSRFGDSFEFRSVHRYRGAIARDSVVYRLQFFALTDTVIAAMPVMFSDGNQTFRVDTAPVPIFFRSSLDPIADELRPIKPIFNFAMAIWPWLLLGILLGLVAYLIWHYRNRLFKRMKDTAEASPPAEIPPFISPLRRLADDLKKLSDTEAFNNQGYKELYFELSIAFRRYFEDVYSILALESTTREVVQDLERRGMAPAQLSLVRELLRESDMVKFARFEPDGKQAFDSVKTGEELVQQFRKTDQQRISMLRHDYEVRYGLRSNEYVSADKRKSVINPMVISEKEDS
jgi:hypothetical protein